MGSLSNESFEESRDALKTAGITISNEAELRERLAEAQRWRFAFQTLAANGKVIGINFEDHSEGRNEAEISRAFNAFHFSEKLSLIYLLLCIRDRCRPVRHRRHRARGAQHISMKQLFAMQC